MTGSHQGLGVRAEGAAVAGAECQPIHVSVAGEDLVLEGRFDHWLPVAMEGTSPDEGAVQLFFDVTGMAPPESVPDAAPDLFSFTATSTTQIGPFAFLAHGVMKHGEAQRGIQAVIQTPAAHTPYFVITFAIDRRRFTEVWDQLQVVVERRAGTETQMYPRAWLKVPELALA